MAKYSCLAYEGKFYSEIMRDLETPPMLANEVVAELNRLTDQVEKLEAERDAAMRGWEADTELAAERWRERDEAWGKLDRVAEIVDDGRPWEMRLGDIKRLVKGGA